MSRAVHTWEEHILCIYILVLMTYYEVRVLLIGRSLLLALINRCAFLHHRLAHVAVRLESHLRSVSLTIEQWSIAILVAAQITAQGEDILRRVLIHRRVGR